MAPSGTLSGAATVRWTGADLDGMAGDARLQFTAEPGALPVSGGAALSWKGRRVTVESSTIDAPGSRLTIAGLIDAATRPMALKLAGTLVSDDSGPLKAFVERRFAPVPGEPAGRITSSFVVNGTTARPVVGAGFEASELTVRLPSLAGRGQRGAGRPVALTLTRARP